MPEPVVPTLPHFRQRAALAAIVIIAVVGFIVLAAVLHIVTAYAGLLLFWYWGILDDADMRKLPSALLGALLGVGTAWLLQLAGGSHDAAALIAVLVFIVVAIFVQVTELAPIAINRCFMLFLTVAAAPLLQAKQNFAAVEAAVLFGAVYFGLIVFLLSRLQGKAATPET